MAVPTRVQTTPQVRASSSTTVSVTFSAPPTVGNAVAVALIMYNASGTGTLTAVDNRGNTYSVALHRYNGQNAAAVLYCSKITTTGTPFTVTVTCTATCYFEAVAIEVNNIVTGLIVDKTNSTTGVSTTPATGSTAAITGTDVFVVSATSVGINLASITVQVVVPAWTQELENLSYSASVAGEADSRSLTGVASSTQSCAWTLNTSGAWSAIIVVFRDTVPAAVGSTQSFIIG